MQISKLHSNVRLVAKKSEADMAEMFHKKYKGQLLTKTRAKFRDDLFLRAWVSIMLRIYLCVSDIRNNRYFATNMVFGGNIDAARL